MDLAKRRPGGVALAVALIACWIVSSAGPLQTNASAQDLRPADVPPSPEAQYLELPHIPAAQLDSAGLSVVRAQQSAISLEARFFGYDLSQPGWNYDASSCPALPDELLLHYRRPFANGTESLFTALVPRAAGRVYVVPILYHNATPFLTAAGSERSIAVFNRVVPPDVAAAAIQPDGKWLPLALCYADIVYGNANVVNRSGSDPGLARAPEPLLHLSEGNSERRIVFTDRNAPGQYLVWTITLDMKGRITAASALQLSDYVARVRKGADLIEKPMPEGKEPPVKTLPPQPEPPVKPQGDQPEPNVKPQGDQSEPTTTKPPPQ